MNQKLILCTLTLFILVSSLFIYLLLTDNWDYFIYQFKWFMRITTPLFIIAFLYLERKKNIK